MAVVPHQSLIKDTDGDALVEAAILFPVMIMIFAGLVLLAVYLPTRAALQRATQHAASAIATERSDTWLFVGQDSLDLYWETQKDNLDNVYSALFASSVVARIKGIIIAIGTEAKGISSKSGEIDARCEVVNRIVYQEIVVTARREFTIPVNLSFIGFPEVIPITVTSTAVVQNGDEFVRNMDLAAEFLGYLSEKLELNGVADKIGSYWNEAAVFFGWRKSAE